MIDLRMAVSKETAFLFAMQKYTGIFLLLI